MSTRDSRSDGLPAELRQGREGIDTIDRQLIGLLAQRMASVQSILACKRLHGIPRIDALREAELHARWAQEAQAQGLSVDLAERVLQALLDASHADPPEPV